MLKEQTKHFTYNFLPKVNVTQ